MQKLAADQGLDGEFLLVAEKTDKWLALCSFQFSFIAWLSDFSLSISSISVMPIRPSKHVHYNYSKMHYCHPVMNMAK